MGTLNRIVARCVVTCGLLTAAALPGAQPARASGDDSIDPAVSTLHDRIAQALDLSTNDRMCMLENLEAAHRLGIPLVAVESIFPGGGRELSPSLLIQLQRIVLDTAGDGLPVDLILAKVREGRIKGVPEFQLARASERMADHVRSAQRILDFVGSSGSEMPDRPIREHMLDEVSLQLWRGITEEGYLSLCETVNGRPAAAADCTAEDLVAAGEVAVRLLEAGVERERALEFARETIRRGYRLREMRQIQVMVAASHGHGQGADEFMRNMEYCVNVDMRPTEMYDYLIRHGWMGPGEPDRVHQSDAPEGKGKGRGGSITIDIERGKRQGGAGSER